jgi:ankyrin repeat protein
MPALGDAIINGDLERVKRLVAEGADVAEANVHGDTVLLWAAYRGRIPIMHWLLNEGGSSLSEKSIEGASALSLAAMNGSFPVVQYLLEERGASMSEIKNYGRTV